VKAENDTLRDSRGALLIENARLRNFVKDASHVAKFSRDDAATDAHYGAELASMAKVDEAEGLLGRGMIHEMDKEIDQ